MIPAPPGYLAHFRNDHGDELVRDVLAFDDGGVALVVDATGGRLVPVTRLGDGWHFNGLASSPRRRHFRFEGVLREVEAAQSPPDVDEDDEPRWCEARPPDPDVFCAEDDDDG